VRERAGDVEVRLALGDKTGQRKHRQEFAINPERPLNEAAAVTRRFDGEYDGVNTVG
jgi:predicted NBD/HSP70 family sugar kinase